jgi:hypothetical protein
MNETKIKTDKSKTIKRWRAYGTVVAGTYIGVVKAETEEEAVQKAYDIAWVSVCHQCSQHISDPEVTEVTVEEISDYEED